MVDLHRHRTAFRSVRARTTLAATLVVGAALVIAAVALVVLLRSTLYANLDQNAESRARDVAAQLRQGAVAGAPSVPNEENAVIQVVRGSKVVVSSANASGEPAIWSKQPPSAKVTFATVRPPVGDGRGFRLAALRSGSNTVLVAVSTEQAAETLATVERLVVIGMPMLLALVAATTWAAAGRSLRPVESIRREVADITASDLDRRVSEPGGEDEIARLAQTMNDMLQRLERGDRSQRQFVGDASHELRSPLAAARTELEVAIAHPELTSWPDIAGEVLAEVVRMQGLVQDLLFLARNVEGAQVRDPVTVDLAGVVTEEVQRARSNSDTVDVDAVVTTARVVGRSDDLARLVRNLVENAVRYATTSVQVTLSSTDGTTTLVVEDDGPGIAPEHQDLVFERFTRLDAGRSRDDGGSGLGLAIVREVAIRHGGAVVVAQSDTGARFVVTLPDAS